MTEVWLAFIAGLAGSTHCLGMCGSIVAAIGMTRPAATPASRQLFQLFYNLGRITTYTMLGVAAGFIGASIDLLAMNALAFWVFAAANLFVIAIGVASALSFSAFNLFSLESGGGWLPGRTLRWALAEPSPARAFPLGMMLGFLPCGLVYAPLIAAAGSGSPLKGGAMMAALGLGTLPLLFLFGSLSATVSGRLRGLFFRLAGFLLALLGSAGLWRLLGKGGYLPRFPFW